MSEFQTVLALDTALNYCSVAVRSPLRNSTETQEMMMGHAEHLMPMVERVLDNAQIAYADINAVAVTNGPGAFTGLRIGLSAARGMALVIGAPLYGINTTQLLALQAVKAEAKPVMVILDTKRGDFYVQRFSEKGIAISSPEVVDAPDFKSGEFTLAGDGVEKLTGTKAEIVVPDVLLMAELMTKDPQFFAEGAEPLYLRGAEVSQSKLQNRVFEGFTETVKK